MKTKTTITVEKWEYTAVRLKRETAEVACRICGEEVTFLSAEAPSAGAVSVSIDQYSSNDAPIAPEHPCSKAKNKRNEKRLIRLLPLDQESKEIYATRKR